MAGVQLMDGADLEEVMQQVDAGAVNGIKEAAQVLAMTEGLTLEYIDLLTATLRRKMVTFMVAEKEDSLITGAEEVQVLEEVTSLGATATPRNSRSTIGGRRL